MLRNCLLKLSRNVKYSQLPCNQPQIFAFLSTSPATKDVLLEQEHIDEAIRVNPVLANVTAECWHRTHETFLNHGLPTTNFLRIVTGNPALLTRPPRKIIDSIELWRSCQFGEKLLYLLITKYPEFLDVNDGRRLLMHMSYLKSFACTSKNVWKLLMNCPNLLEQTEEKIENTMKYLQQVMRIEIPEIVKSEALSKPLSDIRCRHVFLERLALFKPRPLKANPDEPTKNPRLYQITDTSDKTFATKICHVSLVEFEAFSELFTREHERKQNSEKEYDDFDDND